MNLAYAPTILPHSNICPGSIIVCHDQCPSPTAPEDATDVKGFLDSILAEMTAGAAPEILDTGMLLWRGLAAVLVVWTGLRIAFTGDFRPWDLIKALWTYSLYGAIAAAIMRVFLGVSLGYINVIMTTGSGANDFWEAVAWTIALLPLMVAGILSALMVGSLATQLVGGGGGGLMGLAQSAPQAVASKGTHLAKAAG